LSPFFIPLRIGLLLLAALADEVGASQASEQDDALAHGRVLPLVVFHPRLRHHHAKTLSTSVASVRVHLLVVHEHLGHRRHCQHRRDCDCHYQFLHRILCFMLFSDIMFVLRFDGLWLLASGFWQSLVWKGLPFC